MASFSNVIRRLALAKDTFGKGEVLKAHKAPPYPFVALILVALVITACPGPGNGVPPPPRVTAVVVTPNTANISVGETVQLNATVQGENDPPQTVTWTSNDESIATVEAGLVTGVAAGAATITATSTFDPTRSGTAEITVVAGTTTVQGAVGVQEHIDVGIESIDRSNTSTGVAAKSVDGLNAAILAMAEDDLRAQGVNAPIRGVNALVMNSIFQAQNGERAVFNYADQAVVAVTGDGEVVASGDIQLDGSFSLEVPNDETVALMVASQDEEGKWVCSTPLEYQELDEEGRTTGTEQVLFNFGANAVSLRPQQVVAGLFNFNEQSANPAEDVGRAPDGAVPWDDAAEFHDDNYADCGNPQLVRAPVTANFNWLMPPVEDTGYEEEFLYEFGISLGLSWTLSGEEEAAFIAAGPIGPTGLMTMEVAKNVGEVVPMSLLMTDVGFYDEAKIGYPLTPTFDLNAALGQGDIPVDDDGHAYGALSGGMAYRYGYVVDALGNPVADAFVFMILDSEDILAFNYAVTDEYGIYEILAPATGPDMPPYLFAAVDNPDAPTVAGIVRGDLHYPITAVDAVQEDIWLDIPLD